MLKSTLATIFFEQNGPFKEFITKNMQRLNCRVPLNIYGADDDDAVAKDIQMKGEYDFLGFEHLAIRSIQAGYYEQGRNWG